MCQDINKQTTKINAQTFDKINDDDEGIWGKKSQIVIYVVCEHYFFERS